jgi:hypothetical protein
VKGLAVPHRTPQQRYWDALNTYVGNGWEVIFNNGDEATLIRAMEDGLAICDLFKGETAVIPTRAIIPYEAIDRLRLALAKVECIT